MEEFLPRWKPSFVTFSLIRTFQGFSEIVDESLRFYSFIIPR